jgi:hypothetical protein
VRTVQGFACARGGDLSTVPAMSVDLKSLSGSPLTSIFVDNGMGGADRVLVWLRYLSDRELGELEAQWQRLHALYQFKLDTGVATLAREVGVLVPEAVPEWDETFPGTYGEWRVARDKGDAALKEFNGRLQEALETARTDLLANAGGVAAGELWLDGARTLAYGYRFYNNNDGRLRLLEHDGRLYASSKGEAVDVSVFAAARLAGEKAFDEAVAANIEGILLMDGGDLFDLALFEPYENAAKVAAILSLSYPEWVEQAETRRGDLLERATSSDEAVWDELENLTRDGLTFIALPREARQDAERAVLHGADVYEVPAKVTETLLGIWEGRGGKEEAGEWPEVAASADHTNREPRERRGFLGRLVRG